MTATELRQKVEHLEDQIQKIKWLLGGLRSLPKSKSSSSIIKTTAGFLGKTFPCGIKYEDQIRKSWETHFFRQSK